MNNRKEADFIWETYIVEAERGVVDPAAGKAFATAAAADRAGDDSDVPEDSPGAVTKPTDVGPIRQAWKDAGAPTDVDSITKLLADLGFSEEEVEGALKEAGIGTKWDSVKHFFAGKEDTSIDKAEKQKSDVQAAVEKSVGPPDYQKAGKLIDQLLSARGEYKDPTQVLTYVLDTLSKSTIWEDVLLNYLVQLYNQGQPLGTQQFGQIADPRKMADATAGRGEDSQIVPDKTIEISAYVLRVVAGTTAPPVEETPVDKPSEEGTPAEKPSEEGTALSRLGDMLKEAIPSTLDPNMHGEPVTAPVDDPNLPGKDQVITQPSVPTADDRAANENRDAKAYAAMWGQLLDEKGFDESAWVQWVEEKINNLEDSETFKAKVRAAIGAGSEEAEDQAGEGPVQTVEDVHDEIRPLSAQAKVILYNKLIQKPGEVRADETEDANKVSRDELEKIPKIIEIIDKIEVREEIIEWLKTLDEVIQELQHREQQRQAKEIQAKDISGKKVSRTPEEMAKTIEASLDTVDVQSGVKILTVLNNAGLLTEGADKIDGKSVAAYLKRAQPDQLANLKPMIIEKLKKNTNMWGNILSGFTKVIDPKIAKEVAAAWNDRSSITEPQTEVSSDLGKWLHRELKELSEGGFSIKKLFGQKESEDIVSDIDQDNTRYGQPADEEEDFRASDEAHAWATNILQSSKTQEEEDDLMNDMLGMTMKEVNAMPGNERERALQDAYDKAEEKETSSESTQTSLGKFTSILKDSLESTAK